MMRTSTCMLKRSSPRGNSLYNVSYLPVTGDDHELIIWFITIRNDAVGYTDNRGGGVFQWCHFVCFCFCFVLLCRFLLKECFWSFDLMCKILWERLKKCEMCHQVPLELFTRDSTVLQ